MTSYAVSVTSQVISGLTVDIRSEIIMYVASMYGTEKALFIIILFSPLKPIRAIRLLLCMHFSLAIIIHLMSSFWICYRVFAIDLYCIYWAFSLHSWPGVLLCSSRVLNFQWACWIFSVSRCNWGHSKHTVALHALHWLCHQTANLVPIKRCWLIPCISKIISRLGRFAFLPTVLTTFVLFITAAG